MLTVELFRDLAEFVYINFVYLGIIPLNYSEFFEAASPVHNFCISIPRYYSEIHLIP